MTCPRTRLAATVVLTSAWLGCANGEHHVSDARVDTGVTDTAADASTPSSPMRRVIYQLPVRLFSNTNATRMWAGTREQNGVGKFSGITARALTSLQALGVTDLYLLGALRQATLTDHSTVDPRLSADDPDIVKGRAGSYYAVRDYYDVSPDYADVPANRMAEFEALVARAHAAGLRVLIDFVPNHVARSYASVVFPDRDFGRGDARDMFFRNANNYFYLADPAGQSLMLARPATWNPTDVVFDGRYASEAVPRATGNNLTSPNPSANDWYETVKLNYGFNFVSQEPSYSPTPNTWTRMDEILLYWQSKGVDGFRCDFAHYVPDSAWLYLLRRARERDPNVYFAAEAYEHLNELLADGFDDVYFDAGYDALKRVYQGQSNLEMLGQSLAPLTGGAAQRFLVYLENHDERRMASVVVSTGLADDSGFGGAAAIHQLGPTLFLRSRSNILLYSGQELGEAGAGNEGFGGEDGRSTIFDYWSMPTMVPWVQGGFEDASLSADALALRNYYRDLLTLTQDPAMRGARAEMLSAPADGYAFARFADGAGELLLVVSNFSASRRLQGQVSVPRSVLENAGIPLSSSLSVQRIFRETGLVSESTERVTDPVALSITVDIASQSAHVFRVRRSE